MGDCRSGTVATRQSPSLFHVSALRVNYRGACVTYAVKEMFLTLQGEGFHTGRRAVFIRFAGCNLWSGREKDRANAQCKFCDTDFVGGEKLTAEQIVERAIDLWGDYPIRFAVLTGGEPSLQVDEVLIEALHDRNFKLAIETNGTLAAPAVDWVCVSPKAGTSVVQRSGDELKVVWPQPLDLDELGQWDFRHFFIQPMDGAEGSTEAAIRVAKELPHWRLSLQTHKLVGIQ